MALHKKQLETSFDQRAALSRPLTKSRFKLACECPSKLYFNGRPEEFGNDKREDPFLRNLARGGFQVGALAKLYFPEGIEVTTLDYEESLKQTYAALEQRNVTVFEGAFRFENLFVRADIVRKDGDTLYVYEVKAKSFDPERDDFWQKRKTDHINNDWKEYLYDIAFQHFVIRNAFPTLRIVPHLYLANKRAVATVDGLNQRFRLVSENGREKVIVQTHTKKSDVGEEILYKVDVSREVEAIQSGKANGDETPDWPSPHSFSSWVKHLSEIYYNDTKFPSKVTGECKGCEFRIEKSDHPGKASGFEQCWTEALGLRPGELQHRTPIFEIWRLIAPPLLREGTYFIDQLGEEDFIPKSKSKAEEKSGLTTPERKALQWRRTLEEKFEPFFDKEGFREETAGYKFPLHFIDFETATVAIPFNKGRRPYEQIAFQFSHHVLRENGTIEHHGQWISTERGKFPNFDFVRALKKELERDEGTIFRYANHENTVLCQIRTQLLDASQTEVPDREQLIKWIETITVPPEKCETPWSPPRPMVDMLDLVLRFFWHPRMRGSNSIKVVLPAILEASAFLQDKYSGPIYGAPGGIRSLNYSGFKWIQMEGGKPNDPYRLLPAVFENWDRNTLDRMYGDEELADGGAAMMAYAKLQFSEMEPKEAEQISKALLRYCELDTLAMVMLWEGWMHFGESHKKTEPIPENPLTEQQAPNICQPDLQSLYFLSLLRKKVPLWNQQSAARALAEAKIDLIPHQIEAALFAFRNPLSRGVILADEVGLGKTIEAGLVVTQLWYGERKRRVLIICPKSLRGQWKSELITLFGLKASVVETVTERKILRDLLSQPEALLILTEHTACKFLDLISSVHWDLILMDEAHKFRNAWKEDGKSRAIKLRESLKPFRKLLLTATPFQNNLMELFGLCSFIDDRVLGTVTSFRRTFAQAPSAVRQDRIRDLRDRMALFFHRELRRNVLEYVRYTNRHALTVPYEPNDVEEELRTSFEIYLRGGARYGIPQKAAHLLRLVYFKLMSSSAFALQRSLLNLSVRLARVCAANGDQSAFNSILAVMRKITNTLPNAAVSVAGAFEEMLFEGCPEASFSGLRSLQNGNNEPELTPVERESLSRVAASDDLPEPASEASHTMGYNSSELLKEHDFVVGMIQKCLSIGQGTKGSALLHVLQKQFKLAEEKGWPRKAVIFTEFRATQDYILKELEQIGLFRGEKVIVFNGSSGNSYSREALVNQFRESAEVFLTTEAGSEGLNLQFCNLVINFDLPWNPQRIEQRIGRCHRYKQPLDVVVVNFVNERNPADQRILQLLQEKFHLFEGVFGASDEVLGEILNGTDFERQIFELYLKCRTANEIEAQFDALLKANEKEIEKVKDETIKQLSETFTGDVLARLKGVESKIGQIIDEEARLLKQVLENVLPKEITRFDGTALQLTDNYYGFQKDKKYSIVPSKAEDVTVLSGNHSALESLPIQVPQSGHYRFHLNGNDALTAKLRGARGHFWLYSSLFKGLDAEELILPIFIREYAGTPICLDEAECVRIIEANSERVAGVSLVPPSGLDSLRKEEVERRTTVQREAFESQSGKLFSEEMTKVRWLYDDQIREVELRIEEVKSKITAFSQQMKSAGSAVRENQIESAQEKLERELISLEEKKISVQKKSWDAKHERRTQLEPAVSTSDQLTLLAHGSFEIPK